MVRAGVMRGGGDVGGRDARRSSMPPALGGDARCGLAALPERVVSRAMPASPAYRGGGAAQSKPQQPEEPKATPQTQPAQPAI